MSRSTDHYRRAYATTPRVALDEPLGRKWAELQQALGISYAALIRKMIEETHQREIKP